MNDSHALVVSHEPMVRLGLKSFLLSEAGMKVCMEAECSPGVVEVLGRCRPALVVVACFSANGEVPRLIRDIRRCQTGARILVMGRGADVDGVQRVMNAGALGYMTLEDSVADVRLAIASVLAGSLHLSRLANCGMPLPFNGHGHTHGRSCERLQALEALSDREREVFHCVGRGIGCKEMAARMGISVKTVETHKKRIKDKLGLQHSAELNRMALSLAV